jgi:hypothetical protein
VEGDVLWGYAVNLALGDGDSMEDGDGFLPDPWVEGSGLDEGADLGEGTAMAMAMLVVVVVRLSMLVGMGMRMRMGMAMVVAMVMAMVMRVARAMCLDVDVKLDPLDGHLGAAGDVEVVAADAERGELALELAGIGPEVDEGADEHVA